jgi:hypothetical protein
LGLKANGRLKSWNGEIEAVGEVLTKEGTFDSDSDRRHLPTTEGTID